MTTTVTITTHTGGPDVELTTKLKDAVPSGLELMGTETYTETKTIIKAGTVHTETIWGNKIISKIREI